jgi:DNA polymerase-3 subunit epsilon
VIDTMQLEARLHRGKKRPGWLARVLGKQAESIRLADSRLRYGLPLYQAHHALTDALATAELLQAQVTTHYSADVTVGELWN